MFPPLSAYRPKSDIHVHIVLISVVWAVWASQLISNEYWHLVERNWFMSLTMVFGSFVAGATSEGGGAVAFPVMTLGFDISPSVARDFSLMIQSVGMTSAAIMILVMGIRIDWRIVLTASAGGAVGVILGLELVSALIGPNDTKIFFVSFWLGFGLALYWINRDQDRNVLTRVRYISSKDYLMLLIAGAVGGVVSGLTGSGLDIFIFSFMVLYFHMSEKIATPTSVILMAVNSLVGFLWKESTVGMSTEAWQYWWACVPVVVIGAPVGAMVIKNRSRNFVVGFLYISIIGQYIWALIAIEQSPRLIGLSLAIILVSGLFYFFVVRAGRSRYPYNRISWQDQSS